jgi:hypothetical protein
MARSKTVNLENTEEVQKGLDTEQNDILTDDVNSIILEGANEQKQTEALETKTLLRNSGGLETMANELATYRANTVGSEEVLYFIEVPTDTSAWATKAYHMALLLAESNTAESGLETEDIPDVTTKVAGSAITGYKKQLTSSGVFLKGEPVSEFMRYLYDNDVTDDKTVVNLIQVYTFNGDNTNGYEAYKYQASCQVQNGVGGDAQGKAHIEANFVITSEAQAGTATYDKESGVATFTPA